MTLENTKPWADRVRGMPRPVRQYPNPRDFDYIEWKNANRSTDEAGRPLFDALCRYLEAGANCSQHEQTVEVDEPDQPDYLASAPGAGVAHVFYNDHYAFSFWVRHGKVHAGCEPVDRVDVYDDLDDALWQMAAWAKIVVDLEDERAGAVAADAERARRNASRRGRRSRRIALD